MRQPVGRRSLLATLGSLTGLAALDLARPAALFGDVLRVPVRDGPWDLTWLDQLKGRHKQVFDMSNLDVGLIVVTNYLDAANEVFGMSAPEVNTVVGIGRRAYPFNAVDAIWAKYEVGRRWKLKDPATDQWATRNIYLDGTPMAGKVVGVKALVARGTVFWQCNNALNAIVREFAEDTKQPVELVRAELVAGLHPWVRLVPAHTLLIGLAQEHGCAYESVA